MSKDSIAIIGIGCRFPGGVNDSGSFWRLLMEGRDVVTEIPPDRWNIERYFDAEPGLPGKSISKWGGFLDSIDQFDPQFFGISPREAPYVDPQHRLLLETAWEAMEDAGLVLDLDGGNDIGVFVGISHNDYQGIQGTPWEHAGVSPHSPTGAAHSIAANRISYCFNLRGPSVAMDTACSSALTAVHAACEHIRTGRGDTALAGGVTVIITPGGFIGFSQASMLSPEGRCKAFDASADGFVRGEGAGMVVLKKLSKAIEDGDPIHGIILGTALNQDGHTNGISLPSAEAQARLVIEACEDAGVERRDIGYVEAHGTGTAVGDPLEAHALSTALCGERPADAPLLIGSVKTNLGHLETAAGMAGLVKALLVLKHGVIPPSLHFKTPNPHIDFDTLKLRVVTKPEPLPELNGRRLAGVNSFGFGGANAHVLLAGPPQDKQLEHAENPVRRAWPLVISARSEEALRANASRLGGWLDEHSHANGSSPLLPDVTYTLGARRNHHPFRITLVTESLAEAAQELASYAAGQESKARMAFAPRPEHPPRIGFVMSGQGPQWWGMGRELMEKEPVFREAMERAAALMRPLGFQLLEELGRTEQETRLNRTAVAQPAIFAMQIALAELWKSWGVEPAAIVGHSVGEIAAAYLAGVLDLEDAVRIIVRRGEFMDGCARGEGTMLAAGIGEESAWALTARHDRTVKIAAYNAPNSVTLAGTRESLEIMRAELEAQGNFARMVQVDYPFHHPLMEPAAAKLEQALADLQPRGETIPFFSTVTGGRIAGAECGGEYWGNGVRQPVQFASAVHALAEQGVDLWLEIGAHPALVHSIQECLSARGSKEPVFASARREREHESMLETAMDLHRNGVALNFAGMTPSRRQLALPAYAWEKKRWWSEAPDWTEGRTGTAGHGLLDLRLTRAVPTWIVRLDGRHMAYLKDHKVENMIVFPAAAFVEMVLEAGTQLFDGRPFVVEDFEIRKPLILPEPVSGVQIELSHDPVERTFVIQSKFEHGSTWSVHVVGSLRAERTESSFADSAFADADAAAEPKVDVDDFYRHMSEMGLRYGEEFRPVRELRAGEGKSAGSVSVSEAISARAAHYSMHPVLFDGALQIFSAGAATVEGRKAGMKLPVRFSRILFLRSPGISSRVAAAVQQCNDQFLEGRIEIYNEAGEPCLLVEGFRAISVAGARRSSASAGNRNVLYHTTWERTSADGVETPQAPLPLGRLRQAAQCALDKVLATRGRDHLEAAMADADALAAAQLANGFREMAGFAGGPRDLSAESLRIAGPMRPAFERLAANLAKRRLLKKTRSGYRPASSFNKAAGSAPAMLRAFILKHPGHLAEALLCAANGAELGPILRGEKDAVQVLFGGAGAEWLDQFYGEGLYTSHWLAAISAAAQEIASQLPEGRGLRILEVGAGTGGLAAHLLPLLERGLHSYTFSDVSPAFFPAAMQKLAGFPEVEFKVLDLEKSGLEQGFDAEGFHLIVGTNVLHAVSDLRAALGNIHTLLAPGGNLVFMDVANPQLWTDTVFGVTAGWWRFTDRDLRPSHPLLGRDRWESVLIETGFAASAAIEGLVGPEGEGQIGLLAQKAWSAEAPAISAEVPAEKQWFVFSDDSSGLGIQLTEQLTASGAQCRTIRRGSAFAREGNTFSLRPSDPADWAELFRACAGRPPERIVYLWGLDQPLPNPGPEAPLMGTDALLHLAQAIGGIKPPLEVRLDLVTRGAQPAGRINDATAVGAAPLLGLLRVILNEYPNITGRAIDLPPVTSDSDGALLWQELLRADAEGEVAFRGEARYVRRLMRGQPAGEKRAEPAIPLRLESRERGHLDSLRFVPFADPACEPGQVLIEVKAAGMNFRDVLKALALYPGEAPDSRIFGDEVAGVLKSVGPGVSHVRPGDHVFGLAIFGLASVALARAGDIRPIPAGLSFEEAATLPVVFMTSWHALQNVARVRKGEVILVHAGAGGVGMAAIQIAHHLGAEVIASAGSAAKRALLETLGVKHCVDSRRGDFAEAVLKLTHGRGVDVVLNALAGEAIPMGLSCLAQFGRFIEIGKRDIYQNSKIPLWAMRKNASFHVVAMDAVFAGDEALTSAMLGEICKLCGKGAIHPLPFRSFPASRVHAAFRLMAGGKHTGKVVVAFPEPFLPPRTEALAPGFAPKPEGAYLITGAFGGFGNVLAHWLIDCGARHLVLTSRSAGTQPEHETFAQSLRERGASVRIIPADIGLPPDVTDLMKGIECAGQPLKGIFHLAMVIDDAPLASLDRNRMRSVMEAKAYGAWLLHTATREMELDCFAMFSSVSSIFGNPAQGNYSAANAFLDSLAHHRQALGLPALTINWGVLGGVGYVARNQRVSEFLARQGTEALSPTEVMSILESNLAAGVPQVTAIRVDWAKWRQFFHGMQENPLLQRIFESVESTESHGSLSDLRQKIDAATPEELEGLIRQAVREGVASVLRVKSETLRDDQPLTDLGLDSLMGVEIENSIEASLGVSLPPASLLRARTIGHIVTLIAEHMGAKRGGTRAQPAGAVTASPEELNLDALSDAEIDELLGEADEPAAVKEGSAR